MEHINQNNATSATSCPIEPISISKLAEGAMQSREKEHHSFVRKTTPRYGCIYIGPEYDFIHWLEWAEKLLPKIASDDAPPFELIRPSRGKPFYRISKLAKEFYYLSKSYNATTAEHYRHHRFNPFLTVMLGVAADASQGLPLYANPSGEPASADPGFRELLTRAFESIRSTYRSAAFITEVDNFKRNEEKNVASCCEYMAAQFERRSQLLILRIDLYYRSPFKEWGYTLEAELYYARFLRALRENRIVPDVLGYISKREDGIDRGIHYHTLVVLDGHKHRDAANLTRLIGEDWIRRCGTSNPVADVSMDTKDEQHRGSYFNCYSRNNEYQFNGLGLIHPTDTDKLRGLRLAIEYMCKETSQLKATPLSTGGDEATASEADSKASRNLRRGIMPKGHSGRGAPRSSGLDRSAIDRYLLKKQA